MGDCKRNATISFMESSSSAIAMAKRRKIVVSSSNQQLRRQSSSSTTNDELGLGTTENSSPKMLNNGVVISAATGGTCSMFSTDWPSPPPSNCFSNETSSDQVVNDRSLRLVDLQVDGVKSFETTDSIPMNINRNKFSRETTPSSELCGESAEEAEALALAVNIRRRTPSGITPPRNEIEEFFAIAEKTEQKRFTEKYNFDVVKDTPLDGRYQWGRTEMGIRHYLLWRIGFYPERAMSSAFVILNELVEELRIKPCPLVFSAFSGGTKASMYKVFQIIEGISEGQLYPGEYRLVRNCISGNIFDSGPVDFTSDLGTRYALHPTIQRMPGSSKLASWVVKGIASGLDALYLTRFESQRTEYWQALYSSVNLGAPFLILGSEKDDLAPCHIICNFTQRLQELGGDVKFVKMKGSCHIGHYKYYPIQYRAAVSDLLEKATLVFSQKMRQLEDERIYMEGTHDEISQLICDLQKAAVNSNQSLRRVARGPADHFYLPSSSEYQNGKESEPLQDEGKEKPVHLPAPPSINAHSVLGRLLFDACVPKNVEGWDIKFCGSLNRQPFASAPSERDNGQKTPLKFRTNLLTLQRIEDKSHQHNTLFPFKMPVANVTKSDRTPCLKGYKEDDGVTESAVFHRWLDRLVCYKNPMKTENNKRKKVNVESLYNDPKAASSPTMQRAYEVQATLAPEFPSMVKLMLHSHVSVGFWLGLPKKFCDMYLPKEDTMMVLEDESGQVCDAKYLALKVGLSAGWRGFSIAHNLVEGDVVVFHLVTPIKFKVYIIRTNCPDEVDGALGLLQLEGHLKQMTGNIIACEKETESLKPDDVLECPHNNTQKTTSGTSEQSDKDTEVLGPEALDGIRLSDESAVSFDQVKHLDDFNILVNGLIINSELPKYLLAKYYELCCSQKAFLHENILEGLNCKLVAGVISETINIADAIRASKISSSVNDFTTWEKTLKAFEGLGMNVEFLCYRLEQLVSLASKSKRYEKVKVEHKDAKEELRNLEAKMLVVKDRLSNLETEFEAVGVNFQDLQLMFKEVATAPW
uniref:TF-B3 domain-containing protein n=1 Tax=Cannabis sativa TaxID=3483 RepID=A0A803NKP5_CANSA